MNPFDETNYYSIADEPATLLPNAGEGGPAAATPNFGGVDASQVPTTLPNFDTSMPASPSPSTPMPLPNYDTSFPVYPGPTQGITIMPDYNANRRTSRVRILNAAYGYRPFQVLINNQVVTTSLQFASLTPYNRVADGFQQITIAGRDGYVFLQKTIPVNTRETVTIVIVNTVNGIDLLKVPDTRCRRPSNMSCIRVCNVAYYSIPMDVVMYDGPVLFRDVRFKENTLFKQIWPDEYQFYLTYANEREALSSFYVDIEADETYTVYILSRGRTSADVQTLVVEDR